ncbi:MAG: 3-methyl-2-oxobutanoate hydroxymethyltransferase, partial [Acidobacteriota bacterium]
MVRRIGSASTAASSDSRSPRGSGKAARQAGSSLQSSTRRSKARWAEAAGVDVCVVGDSLAMVAHGHASTIP